MKKTLLILAFGAAALSLTGCVVDGGNGRSYRSDVYSASGVNQLQNVMSVTIVSINPAQVKVPVTGQRAEADKTGMILGAIAGAAIGNHNHHSTSSRVMGGLAGAALGNLAGDAVANRETAKYVDGVQIIYRAEDGRMYQSTQVGRMCEYQIGAAVLVAPSNRETRIQPNNPYGCGRQ